MTPHDTTAEPEHELLAALTLLVANWASVAVQDAIAHRAGVAVDPADVQPLYTLGQTGPQRASTLAATLRLSRPTMSKQLRRLTDAGFVIRSADSDDGRASIVALSPSGADAYDRLVREGIAIVRRALAEWDAAGTDSFARDLSRFVAALAVDDADDEQG
ncbi:MarR family winged helix-turn-helix transcriptional regulator [Rathayibacter sp. CAU 1779]